MNGKCYSIEQIINEKDLKPERPMCSAKGKADKDTSCNKRLEHEKLYSPVEERCVMLRSELERVKQRYTNGNDFMMQNSIISQNVNNKLSNSSCKQAGSDSTTKPAGTKIELDEADYKSRAKAQFKNIMRQNSNAIGTDTSGAAMTTMNNIIDGITESIHFPDIPTRRAAAPVNTSNAVTKSKVVLKQNKKTSKNMTEFQESLSTTRRNVSNNILEIQEMLNLKPKRVTSKYSSNNVLPKKKKMNRKKTNVLLGEDQSQNILQTTLSLISKRSRKSLRKQKPYSRMSINKSVNKSFTKPTGLVEIYHNIAVKESESSEVQHEEKVRHQVVPIATQCIVNNVVVPPLNMNMYGDQDCYKKDTYNVSQRGLTALSRNYEMPTIASQLKKVAKYYYMNNSYNIKVIPFCPATSITPSHNIGINIQQVMNMLKTKQPLQEISPTLVHNIGMAADKWKKPMPFVLSTVTSRACSRCPLMKQTPNYKQMQEMAKLIPEDIIEENVDENDDDDNDSDVTQTAESVIVTGPSGDMKITKRKESVWTMNSNTHNEKCTCCPTKGVDFQHMLNKYKTNAVSIISSQISRMSHQQQRPKAIPMKAIARPNPAKTVYSTVNKIDESIIPSDNKQKKLKDVLAKLHKEFETMQNKYEELSTKSTHQLSPEMKNEIKRLDVDLNSKEQEIEMVVELYNEVLALKDQVKTLKDPTSRETVAHRQNSSDYQQQNSSAAIHFNKLLREVQRFKSIYSKK